MTTNVELHEAIAQLEYKFDTRLTKDLQTYDALIDERLDKLREEMRLIAYETTMKSLCNSQPQQPARSPDVLLHKRLNEIAQENAPDAPKLVIAAMANHFKELVDGRIYQHLQYIYGSLN